MEVSEYEIAVRGRASRVREAGSGNAVVFFAGIGGLPAWPEFLTALAEQHRVIAPSLPGFPGAEEFRHLDSYLDWIVAALEVLEALDVTPVDLIGSSVGGTLAAEVAALAPERVRRLALIAPFGHFDPADPGADIWAQRPGPDSIPTLVCRDPERWNDVWAKPDDADPVEWGILLTRAMEAAARYLFPMGDTGLVGRLNRVHQPTLLARGAADAVIPESYQAVFAEAISGPVVVTTVPDAGHLAELDQPEQLAREINAFLMDQQG
jgi:pimeloyl-ACP methyl ester carboxylesterase